MPTSLSPVFDGAQDTGLFSKKSETRSAQEQMMTNPDMMTNMVKQSVGGFLPQVSALTPLLVVIL